MTRGNDGLTTLTKPGRRTSGERDISHVWHAFSHALEGALQLPSPARSRWHRAGVGTRTERVLDVLFGAVLLTFAAGWTWSIAEARAAEGPLDDTTPPPPHPSAPH